jgi:hypothetical protein
MWLQTLSPARNGLFGPLDDGSLGAALAASLTALDASDNAAAGALQRHTPPGRASTCSATASRAASTPPSRGRRRT